MSRLFSSLTFRITQLLLIFACSLTTLVRGSLEPVGYRPPGTYPQTRYLPPSSTKNPDNRYLSPSGDNPSQDVVIYANEVSSGLSLPTQNEPVPFARYQPSNGPTTDHYPSVISERNNNVYLPTNEISRMFTPPMMEYLPPKDNTVRQRSHSGSSASLQDRNYLTPNIQTTSYSTRPFGLKDISATERQSGFGTLQRQDRIDDSHNYEHSSGYETQRIHGSRSSGYDYQSPENQTPAKYDFEYEVKDNYGNDYGHKEARNGEHTQGVYKVLLPDGRRQIVHYEADSHGYRPMITYEEADPQLQQRQSAGYNY